MPFSLIFVALGLHVFRTIHLWGRVAADLIQHMHFLPRVCVHVSFMLRLRLKISLIHKIEIRLTNKSLTARSLFGVPVSHCLTQTASEYVK